MHALIGVHADRAGIGEPECPARLQPIPNQVMRQTLPEPEFQRLAKPALRHVEDQQYRGDQAEDDQLLQELRKVPA